MATTQSKFATNITMTLEGVKMGILLQAHSEAAERNHSLPRLHEFVMSSNVHFLDAEGKEVDVSKVIITCG